MTHKNVKYRDLKKLLAAHGLKEERAGEILVFRVNELPDIILPHYRDVQVVHPAHIFSVRQTLSLAGVVEEDQFDEGLVLVKHKIRAQRSRPCRKAAVTRRRSGGGGGGVGKVSTTLAAAPER